jgi:hypothetical protein
MTTETPEQGFPFVLTRFRKDYGLTQQVKAWEHGDPRRQPHVLTKEGALARLEWISLELDQINQKATV